MDEPPTMKEQTQKYVAMRPIYWNEPSEPFPVPMLADI